MEALESLLDGYVRTCDRIGEACGPPWYVGNVYIELILVACLFTLVQLVLIRHVGFPNRLRNVRRSMVAAAYGMLLYRRRPKAIVVGELRLVWNSLKFLVFLLPSLALGGLLFAGLWHTLSGRYGHGPLRIGEEAVVRAEGLSDSARELSDCDVVANGQDLEVTARVRAPAVRTVWTRVRPRRAGLFQVEMGQSGAEPFVLNVAMWESPVAPRQTVDGVAVSISYPTRRWWGSSHGWLVCFLVVCLVAAWPLGRLLGTRL